MIDRFILIALLTLAFSLPISIAASHVLLGILSFLCLYQIGIQRRLIIHTPLNHPVAVFIVVVGIGALSGSNPAKSIISMTSLWHIALCFMIIQWVHERTVVVRLLLILMTVGALNGIYGIIQHFSGGLDLFRWYSMEKVIHAASGQIRATGTFSHYMTFSGQMLILSLLGLGLLLSWARGKSRWWFGGATAIFIVALVSSLTRNSWIGFMVGVLVMGWLSGKRIFLLMMGSLFIVITLGLTIYPTFRERAISILDMSPDGANFERIRTWQTTLDMINDHRLLGVGFGNYKTEMDRYRDRYGAELHSHAHNTLLQVTAENGIIGFMTYVMVWSVFFFEAVRRLRKVPDQLSRGIIIGGIGAMAGFHAAGFFEYNLGDSEVAMLMWLTVGLTMAAWMGRFGLKTG